MRGIEICAGAAQVKKIENGKPTYWTEAEVTLLLEKIKRGNNNQHNLPLAMEGIETTLSKEFRLAMIYKQEAELMKEAATLERELRVSTEQQLQATQNLLNERETGLEVIQRIAEAGGLMLTDRDDLLAMYGRRA